MCGGRVERARRTADMVHCDIKPQNFVLFAAEQAWKLIDIVTACGEGEEVPVHFTLMCAACVGSTQL